MPPRICIGNAQAMPLQNNSIDLIVTSPPYASNAIDYMRADVINVLKEKGVESIECEVNFETQWNSNMISEKGRKALKEFGLAPPPKHDLIVDLDILENVPCPYCNSENTELRNPFGPTLCRSIHYCNDCSQAFEQFKPV